MYLQLFFLLLITTCISQAFILQPNPSQLKYSVLKAKKDDLEVVKKAEFIEKVADKAGVSKTNAEAVVAAAFDTVVDCVAGGKKLTFLGFGTFEPRTRSARAGRNPQTGETIQIAETTTPAFSPAKSFKDKVKGKV
mmetsp:Transcript_25420/g.33187  ORF Transcript_25420/g.33187 Transcript_25420/m.33187 type:complete len:136 (+) Transcript_25420:181-588(+)|eukprot:CAMPEP_0117746572 /NCGR_PEP_ID=MMETSP0947-20121206/8024_1 /TAXON_ID=44440 /ORGANISM="Chattonella subsalsa, Strain CCMP2191" /LENGTH=135 /DNA_ID=CAMNT_0005563917 /DNA_START=169 /DNA_END=576 /DNA_ORIENTATION=+